MRAQTEIRSGLFFVGLFFVGLFVLGTAAQCHEKPSLELATTYGTPQAVFDAALDAEKKKDYKTVMKCMTQESQDRLTVQVAASGAISRMLLADDHDPKMKAHGANLEKVLVKHGLTKEVLKKYETMKGSKKSNEATKALAAVVKDKAAFMSEVKTIMEKMYGPRGRPADSKLKDLKIAGDKARGMIVTKENGKDSSEPIEFVKVGGSWRIVLPEAHQEVKDGSPKGPPVVVPRIEK